MKTKRTLTIATVLVALIALMTLGFRGTQQAQAQDVSPPIGERISFGMLGITQGQTLRVNAANVVAQNDSGLPPGPYRVAIIIINSRGEVFRNRDGSPVRKLAMLDSGESSFLELNADDLQLPPGPVRVQLRAVVSVLPAGTTDNASPIAPSVEVINNANGRTVLFIGNPGVIRGFNPQPDPPLGQ